MPETQSPAWISLKSSELSAEINPLGAQLSVLRDARGRELLWNGDPAVWAGRAPILFPIVGTLAGGHYRLGSSSYPLSRHGFARGRLFQVLEVAASSALFRLQADADTLKVYPFQFQLDVSIALNGPTVSVSSSVRNLGHEDMPASIGYHPGFRWPLPYGEPRASHFIEFATDEGPSIRRLDGSGLVAAERYPTPVSQRRLPLQDSLFENDVVIFDDIRSRAVTYGSDKGPRIRVGFPDARFLGLWTRPGAGFICIEPWHGISDEAGFAGDFKDKWGVFTVPPGTSRQLNMDITLAAE